MADGCDCKVGTAVERFGLDGLDAHLAEEWTDPDGGSLRELAAETNRRILRSALRAAAADPPGEGVGATYRLLAGETGSEGGRVAVRNRLERQGVAVDAVESAFVSHATVHSHLRDCLGVSHAVEKPAPDERVETAERTLGALRSRLEAVTETTVDQLRDAGVLALPAFDVYVDVNVACRECGRYHSVTDLLAARGCDCRQE